MIEIRPVNPVKTVGDRDPLIASFANFEWRDLIELAQQYGFEPPDIERYYPHRYEDPVEIDAETSQGLWEAISAVYNDEAIPYAHTWEDSNVGKLRVKQLMECAQIGAEHGGIEIRQVRDKG